MRDDLFRVCTLMFVVCGMLYLSGVPYCYADVLKQSFLIIALILLCNLASNIRCQVLE